MGKTEFPAHFKEAKEDLKDRSWPATWELLSNQWPDVKTRLALTWWGRTEKTEVHDALLNFGAGHLVYSEYFYETKEHKGRYLKLISVTFNDGNSIKEMSVHVEKDGPKTRFGCSGLTSKDQAHIVLRESESLWSVMRVVCNIDGRTYTPLELKGCQEPDFISELVMQKRILMELLDNGVEWWGDDLDPENVKHDKQRDSRKNPSCGTVQDLLALVASRGGRAAPKDIEPAAAYTYRNRLEDPCYLFEVSTCNNIYTVSLEKEAMTVSVYESGCYKPLSTLKDVQGVIKFFRNKIHCCFVNKNLFNHEAQLQG